MKGQGQKEVLEKAETKSGLPYYMFLTKVESKELGTRFIGPGLVYLKPGLNVDVSAFHFPQENTELTEDTETPEVAVGDPDLEGVLGAAATLTKFVVQRVDDILNTPKANPDAGYTIYKSDILASLRESDLGDGLHLCEVEVPPEVFIERLDCETEAWKTPIVYIGKTKKVTTSILKNLLDSGANVNAAYGNALVVAANSGNASMTKLFLKYGADPHTADSIPFFNALNAQKQDVIKAFLDGGFDVHYACERPLRWSAGKGDLPAVKLFLKYGADPTITHEDLYLLNGPNVDNSSYVVNYYEFENPLLSAVRGGNFEVFECLISAGADLASRVLDVLKTAASTCDIEMFTQIFNHIKSHNLEVSSSELSEVLARAISAGNVGITKFLWLPDVVNHLWNLLRPNRESILCEAIRNQHTEMLSFLFTKFKWSTDYLSEALSTALELGDLSMSKKLVELGADPTYANYSLFKLVADRGNMEALHFLSETVRLKEKNEPPTAKSSIDIPVSVELN